MTLQNLYTELAELIENATKDIAFKDVNQKEARLTIFNQNIAKNDNDEDDPFPYAIIRLVNGTSSATERVDNNTRVLLIFGVCEYDMSNIGDIMLNIINRITQKLHENNVLKTWYQDGKIEWAIDDEDTYPYFFEGMTLNMRPAYISKREELYI